MNCTFLLFFIHFRFNTFNKNNNKECLSNKQGGVNAWVILCHSTLMALLVCLWHLLVPSYYLWTAFYLQSDLFSNLHQYTAHLGVIPSSYIGSAVVSSNDAANINSMCLSIPSNFGTAQASSVNSCLASRIVWTCPMYNDISHRLVTWVTEDEMTLFVQFKGLPIWNIIKSSYKEWELSFLIEF